MHKGFLKLLGLMVTLGLAANVIAQSAPPVPIAPAGKLLDEWTFSGTNFLGIRGSAPTSLTNVALVQTWAGNGLQVDDTNAAWIIYPVIEPSERTNLDCAQGTIETWFSPDWNSADGIGNWGTILEVGAWNTNLTTATGAWGLYISPDASTLYFSAQTNGMLTNYLNAPIAWYAGDWHHIAVTFSATNSALYLEGQYITNGPGVSVVPSSAVQSNGLSIGSDGNGTGRRQIRGVFNNLATYNYQLDAATISNFYTSDSDFVYPLPSTGGGSHANSAPTPPGPGGGGTNGGGGGTFVSPSYSTNDFWLSFAGITNNTSYLLVHSPPTNGMTFDLFVTTNLNYNTPGLNATNWMWLLRGTSGQTNFTVSNIFPNSAFFLFAYTNDGDGDGLSDAFEKLVSHTDPTNPDTDYDGVNDGQEWANGTNPLNSGSTTNRMLGLWRFDTLTWEGEQGQLPLTNVGLSTALVEGVEADAVNMFSTNASKRLAYREYETNGTINGNLRCGTMSFWFQPAWNSVTNGGPGPGHVAPLIAVGTWTSNASIGEWRIALNSNGDSIALDTQDNTGHSVALPWGTIPGGMLSNQWRQIVASYSPSNAAIYVDGTLVSSNSGLSNIYPSQIVRSQGYFIGTDSSGSNGSQGAFDMLATYNYAFTQSDVTNFSNPSMSLPPVLLSTISIANPVDLKWTTSNYLYVLSGSSAAVTEYDSSGNVVRSITGIAANCSALDVDTNGNVYVVVTSSNQVWRFAPTSNSFAIDTNFNVPNYGRVSGSDPGQFNTPYDVAISPDGNYVYVSDTGNQRIQKFDTNGNYILSIGSSGSGFGQFNNPNGISFSPDGNLYVTDAGNNQVVEIVRDEVFNAFGTNGTAPGQYDTPLNVAANAQFLYVADTENNRIQILDRQQLTPVLTISTPFGLNEPYSVSIANDPVQERLYVADTGNDRVLVIAIPKNDPIGAWNTAKQALIDGDIEKALVQFSETTLDSYRILFNAAGTSTLSTNMSAIGQLTPTSIDDDEARYYFSVTNSGQPFMFPVSFANEHGIWKIRTF